MVEYISSGPVIAMILQGSNAVAVVRKLVGDTYPGEAQVGTIRGDFAHISKMRVKKYQRGVNLIHASANKAESKQELSLWFSVDEVHDYKLAAEHYLM